MTIDTADNDFEAVLKNNDAAQANIAALIYGLDEITHSMIWSMLANCGALVVVSLLVAPGPREQAQAVRFVDVFRQPAGRVGAWGGEASLDDLRGLLGRFLGGDRAAEVARRFWSDPSTETVGEYGQVCIPLYTRRGAAVPSSVDLFISWITVR